MKILTFFITLFSSITISAQYKQGDLLAQLSLQVESQHHKFQERSPGNLTTNFSFRPRIGYFVKQNLAIGCSPNLTSFHFQSLEQFGEWRKIRNLGGEIFIRMYAPPFGRWEGLRLFGELSGQGNWQREKRRNRFNASTSYNLDAHVRFGISQQLSRSLFLELSGEYKFFEEYKNNNVLIKSTLWPGRPFVIRGGFRIILESGKYLEQTMPTSRKDWKNISGNLSFRPVSGSFYGLFKKGKFINERLLLGIGTSLGIGINTSSKYFQLGAGPLAKYLLPLSPRFGFIAACEAHFAANYPIFNSGERQRANFFNATTSLGTQYFLNENLALEIALKRPFFWRNQPKIDHSVHSFNGRVIQFAWQFVYYFK